MNLDTDLTPFTKLKYKLIEDLNANRKAIELLDNNIGENLNDLGYNTKGMTHERIN